MGDSALQSPLLSSANSDEITEESPPLSQRSSCASMSTDRDSIVTPELLSEAYAEIEGTIDRLNNLSRSIRKSGMVQSDGRGETFIPKDDNGADMRPEFESYARLVLQREVPEAGIWLQQRLLDSILKRWTRLLYRRRHQQKLSRVAQHVESELSDTSVTQEVRVTGQTSKVPAMSSTYPSVMPGSQPLVRKRSSATDLSRKIRSSIQGSKLDIPRPPRSSVKNNVFECPYCCILCPSNEASGSLWT